MATQYFTNGNQIFRVAKSSNGRLHASLNTGSQDFYGYVDTVEEAIAIFEARFGKPVYPH